MDELLVLLGALVLAIPCAVLYLLVSHSRLKSRVRSLENALSEMRTVDQVGASPLSTSGSAQTLAPQKPVDPSASSKPQRAQPHSTAAATQAAGPPARPPAPKLIPRVTKWLLSNWFYVVSALSLALAGLFLVQYGVENGFLPPTARVLAALVFGAALIAAGEVIRRRFGDAEDGSTAYLPSVFSGAGLVSLFGGVTAARLLYDLVGVETAFVGLALAGLTGVVLGWFNGPLLAAVGVIGAFGAPLLVGSDAPATAWLYLYFAVVAVVGLGIDTVRRWAWVSVLSVVGAFAMGSLTYLGSAPAPLSVAFVTFSVALALCAIAVPARSLQPDHPEPTVMQSALMRGRVWPVFPTGLAAGAVLAGAGASVFVAWADPAAFWAALLGLSALCAALIIWSVRAPGVQDLALLPSGAVIAVIALQGAGAGPVWQSFANAYLETSEAAYPWAVTAVWALGLGVSLLCAGRAMRPGLCVAWAVSAALTAPAIALALEVTWQPVEVIGAYVWALHALVLAAVMVALAARFARVDGEDRLRVSVFALSALSAMTFALVLILSSAALTVALAVAVLAAAWLDRQFRLPLMQVFITLGVVSVGARLIVDPGLDWAVDRATVWELVLAYGGALGAFVAALWALRDLPRKTAKVMLDTAAWSVAGVFASLLLMRFLEAVAGRADRESHWAAGLYAAIWLILAVTQFVRRARLGGRMRIVRALLGAVFAMIGLGSLALGLTVFNPLLAAWGGPVLGPPVMNSLAVGYLLPALVLGFGAWRLPRGRLRIGLTGLAGALAVFWSFVMLRHVWQGPEAMALSGGFLQPELWSYTLALLTAGAAVFYQALARRSVLLRRVGLVVIGAAVAKVFFVDISGLDGLTRVLSLAVLGLSLAGLAWLDRWAQRRV